MLNSKIRNDEKGAFFVFGPQWFVIIIMLIAFLAPLLKNNDKKSRNTNQVNDYIPIKTSTTQTLNICPQCGNNNKKYSKFCNGCGTNLMDIPNKYCPECGAINTSKAKFCQECGNDI